MELLSRAIVIAAIVLGGALVIRGLYPADRFTMIAVQGGAYRLDRLTGAVIFCDAVVCRPLPLATIRTTPQTPPKSGDHATGT